MATNRFVEPPDTRVLTLRGILQGRPVLFVEHDEKGGWHFFDGRSVFEGPELVLVPVQLLLERDPSLGELGDLPTGWRAWRDSPGWPWERESSTTLDRTRTRTGQLLDQMAKTARPLPPGSPSTTDLLREDRER